MNERVFNVRRNDDGGFVFVGEYVNAIPMFLEENIGRDESATVTVRIEKPPPRVPWPWPDVNRVKLGRMVEGYPRSREVLIWAGSHWISWFVDREHTLDGCGTWPANESRIAINDCGFVLLEKCE